MRPVSDGFLLTAAQIAATLIGLLVVGAFFYLETGFRRLTHIGPVAGPFLRSFTKLTLLLYAFVLALALALVVLQRYWVTAVFVVMSVAVLAGLIDVTARARELPAGVRKQHATVSLAWIPVLVAIVTPWALEGFDPSREAHAWTLLLAGALAFTFTLGLVLLTFDLAAVERAAGDE